jgi:hypothetical protein
VTIFVTEKKYIVLHKGKTPLSFILERQTDCRISILDEKRDPEVGKHVSAYDIVQISKVCYLEPPYHPSTISPDDRFGSAKVLMSIELPKGHLC